MVKELQDRINTLEHVNRVSTRDAMAQHKRALQSAFSQHAEQLKLVQETALKNIIGKPGGGPTQFRGDQRSSGGGDCAGAQKFAQMPPPPCAVHEGALGHGRRGHCECNSA